MQFWAQVGRVGAMLAVGVLAARGAQQVTVTGRVAITPGARVGKSAGDSKVVVWLTPVGADPPAGGDVRWPESQPPRRLRMVQKEKRFDPHLVVITVGSVVEFPNRDPLFHNVFSLFEGKRFDLGLYEAGTTRSERFDRPGISYIFCNIHPQMSAVVVTLATPYYAVSDHAGEVKIPHVPPGRYLLEIWDERALPEELKSLAREVSVREDAPSLGTITLTESVRVPLPHKNKYGRDYDSPAPPSPLYDQP